MTQEGAVTPSPGRANSDPADQQSDRDAAVIHIAPPRGAWASLKLRESWQYRGLAYYLVWRDIKVRYKQTVLGGLWAVIPPLFSMVVFSVIFGRLANIPSEGVPYPLFAFAGLVPFQFFQTGTVQASESLISNANLIRKVYFPRLIAPTAAVLAGLVDFGVAFGVLLVMTIAYGFVPRVQVLLMPLFLLLAFITALGLGLWFAGLNARYRDIRYTTSFIMQAILFLSPVAYPADLIQEPWRTLYSLNPLVGVVEGFRWVLLGTPSVSAVMLLSEWVVALSLMVSGAFFFKRLERTFTDVL